MSGALKKLAGQTALYGLSSIVGRFLNYFLVPLYTYQFTPAEYGVVTEFYAYVAFLVVLLTYGMETAFFRFLNKFEQHNQVLSTALIALLNTSILFMVGGIFFSNEIAALLHYPDFPQYVVWFVLILGLDALSAIPMAQLRHAEKPLLFASINLGSIGVNLGLNVFFIWYCKGLYDTGASNFIVDTCYNPSIGIGYIFIANLAGSVVKLLFVAPIYRNIKAGWNRLLFKEMFVYAYPVLIASLAGIVNETIDRIMLKYLLMQDMSQAAAMAQVGIYGACYKVAMLVSIALQAYRYAAEPFFFKKSTDADSKAVYASVFFYFVAFLTIVFIGITTYIDVVMLFVGEEFRVGVTVVPILLVANIFLGIYYNLSIWYKLTDQTYFGALLGILGAVITIAANWLLIPLYGYVGSAWATLICYATIALVSYRLGQKHYPVNYQLHKLLPVVLPAAGLYLLYPYVTFESVLANYVVRTVLFLGYLGFVFKFVLLKNLKPSN